MENVKNMILQINWVKIQTKHLKNKLFKTKSLVKNGWTYFGTVGILHKLQNPGLEKLIFLNICLTTIY